MEMVKRKKMMRKTNMVAVVVVVWVSEDKV
jgi:hypothetical protein